MFASFVDVPYICRHGLGLGFQRELVQSSAVQCSAVQCIITQRCSPPPLPHSTDESVGALNAGAPTNPWKEVVLRLETMPRTLVKLIYNSIKLAIFVSVISLILLFVAKMVRV